MEVLVDTTGHDHDADSSPGHTSKIRPLIEGVRTYHGDVNDEDTEDDSMSSTSLLGGGEAESRRRSRRWPFQARWSIPQDDFYVRVVDAFNGWRKTRRKSWRTFGRFAYTLLKAVIFSSWAIKLQLVFLITSFVLTLVFTIHIYHHSHLEPYPWRQHCAAQPPFPMEQYIEAEPVGILVGVMSVATEAAAQRRMDIRKSWASHWASRGHWGKGGIWSQSEMDTLGKNIMDPTSRLVVRFVMGRPQPEFREAIREEMKQYNDIVIVPMRENMNDGKTFAFFDWTFKHALVPPPTNATSTTYQNSYHETRNREHASDDGRPHRHGWSLYRPFESMPPASHDPLGPDGKQYIDKEGWVRPDYLVKVDDDSFIMLAELEARLRVLPRKGVYWGYPVRGSRDTHFHAGEAYALSWDLVGHISTYAHRNRGRTISTTSVIPETLGDVEDISTITNDAEKRHWRDADRNRNGGPPRRHRQRFRNLALPISGREDQVTSWWMKDHGEEWGVTWYDELCWIYDHPKAVTVYSKGFLFPLEVSRIMDEWNVGLRPGLLDEAKKSGRAKYKSRPEYKRLYDATYSTVLRAFYRYSYPFAPKWDSLYRSPLPAVDANYLNDRGLWIRRDMELDALVEGSDLSMLVSRYDDEQEIERRWRQDMRRGWRGRYLLDAPSSAPAETRRPRIPIGGTVVVHFVKKSEYWRDCVDVLLEGWTRERRMKAMTN